MILSNTFGFIGFIIVAFIDTSNAKSTFIQIKIPPLVGFLFGGASGIAGYALLRLAMLESASWRKLLRLAWLGLDWAAAKPALRATGFSDILHKEEAHHRWAS